MNRQDIYPDKNMPAVKCLIRECRRILQHPIYSLVTWALPIFCYVFFASIMRDGMPRQLPVAVVDMDNSALSRSIIRKIEASPQTKVVSHLHSYHEGKNAMQEGRIFGFILLPQSLQAEAMSGRQPEIVFHVNNSYLIPGSLLMRDLSTIAALSSASLNINSRAGRGQSPQEITANVQPVALDFHAPGNPWANYSVYLSTILSHGLLQILILLTTVYATGIEIKQGTSGEWLRLSNNSMIRALTGKLLPYTVLFSLMACAGNILFFKYLHFPYHGSLTAMLLAAVMMVVAYQAMGVFILGLLGDFKIALTIAGVFGVLGISFSGLTFPIEIMDTPLQGFSWIFPIRYYFYVFIHVVLHGLPAIHAFFPYLALLAFSLFPFSVIWRLKKMCNDRGNVASAEKVPDSFAPSI